MWLAGPMRAGSSKYEPRGKRGLKVWRSLLFGLSCAVPDAPRIFRKTVSGLMKFGFHIVRPKEVRHARRDGNKPRKQSRRSQCPTTQRNDCGHLQSLPEADGPCGSSRGDGNPGYVGAAVLALQRARPCGRPTERRIRRILLWVTIRAGREYSAERAKRIPQWHEQLSHQRW